MAEDPENHTIRLLQEMRAEMREMRAETHELRIEMRQGFEDVNLRMDGLTHILTMLAGHIHQHDERIEKLENRAE